MTSQGNKQLEEDKQAWEEEAEAAAKAAKAAAKAKKEAAKLANDPAAQVRRRDARIETIGEIQSCMVSKLQIISRRNWSTDSQPTRR